MIPDGWKWSKLLQSLEWFGVLEFEVLSMFRLFLWCHEELMCLFGTHRGSRRAGSESRRRCDHGGAGGQWVVQRHLQGIYWLLSRQLCQSPGKFQPFLKFTDHFAGLKACNLEKLCQGYQISWPNKFTITILSLCLSNYAISQIHLQLCSLCVLSFKKINK